MRGHRNDDKKTFLEVVEEEVEAFVGENAESSRWCCSCDPSSIPLVLALPCALLLFSLLVSLLLGFVAVEVVDEKADLTV